MCLRCNLHVHVYMHNIMCIHYCGCECTQQWAVYVIDCMHVRMHMKNIVHFLSHVCVYDVKVCIQVAMNNSGRLLLISTSVLSRV